MDLSWLKYTPVGWPYLAAEGAAGVLGDFFGTDDPSIPQLGQARSFSLPRLFRYIELGGNLDDLFLTKKAAKGLSPLEKQRIGGKKGGATYRIPTTQELEALSAQRETRLLEAEKASFEKLKSSPFYESLLADSQGGGSYATKVAQLGERALGGAAGSGINIADPRVQAKVLGPLALQLSQFQRESGLLGLNMTRGPNSPFSEQTGLGLPGLQQNVLNTYTAQFGQGQAKTEADFLKSGQRYGLLESLFDFGGSAFGSGKMV